jgi:hypothetical protein
LGQTDAAQNKLDRVLKVFSMGMTMNTRISIGSFQGPIIDHGFEKNLNSLKQILIQTRGESLDFFWFPDTDLSGYSRQAIRESLVILNNNSHMDV